MSLTKRGRFIINGTHEFQAQKLDVDFESVAGEDSGRTDDGVMHIDWVLPRVRKIKITLRPGSSESMAQVLSLVQGREYDITYWDIIDNAEKTIRVYTSNASSSMYNGFLYSGVWQNVSFNAIQIDGERGNTFTASVVPNLTANTLMVASSSSANMTNNKLIVDPRVNTLSVSSGTLYIQ